MAKLFVLTAAVALGTSVALSSTAAPKDAPSQAEAAKVVSWVGCGISKRGFMQDLAKAYEQKTGIKIVLEGGGATKGLRQVSAKASQLGGSCRLPLVYRKKGGSVRIDAAERKLTIIPMGWDALVAITHKDNKAVETISLGDLRKVLTGEITNWNQLGAEVDQPINLYVRKGKISGVGLTLRQQLFNNVDQEFSGKATVLPSSGKIEKAIEKDPWGLAVSGISSSRHRNVGMLQLEGVEPTMANLKRGKYMLYRVLFLVAPPDYESNHDIKQFVDFALSLEGQKVIQNAGTLPYHKGIILLRTGASAEYVLSMEAIDKNGMYSLGGN